MKEYEEFVDVSATAHGFQGYWDLPLHQPCCANSNYLRPLKVGLPQMWDPEFGNYLRAISGKDPINQDHNSGNPLGMAVAQFSALEGRRTTASDALLHSPPTNLTIMTNSAVTKIIFDQDSRRAVGVEASGKKCSVSSKNPQ